MLVSTDYTGKKETLWKCDRCGEYIPSPRSKRYKIDFNTKVDNRYKMVKTFDLCTHCAILVKKAIEKGGSKVGDSKKV